MPNTGKLSFTLAGNTTVSGNEQKITLMYEKSTGVWQSTGEKLTINFKKGTISAKTDAAAYFVGNTVKVTGSTTAGDITTVALAGTNFVNNYVKVVDNDFNYGAEAVKTFEFEINTATVENDKTGFDGKKLDVGTYTLTINTTSGVKATVPLVLKQPFISIVEAPLKLSFRILMQNLSSMQKQLERLHITSLEPTTSYTQKKLNTPKMKMENQSRTSSSLSLTKTRPKQWQQDSTSLSSSTQCTTVNSRLKQPTSQPIG